MPFPVIALAGVLLLIAVRHVVIPPLGIWQIMLLGAAAVLLSGAVSPRQALAAINGDVMVFLFGVFVVGRALEDSGYLFHLSYRLFARARRADALLLLVLFGAGAASALLMNDTVAVIGTPLMLLFARQHAMSPKVLLLALAYAVTLGSAMSPIGNPQNLLIALHGGFADPFVDFARYLALPTLVNLLLAYAALKLVYRESFHKNVLVHVRGELHDPALVRLVRLALVAMLVMVAIEILASLAGASRELRLTDVALAGAAPILLFSPRRWRILQRIDWHTLVFFAALFVLMDSVWRSGFFQGLLGRVTADPTAVPAVFAVSVLLSQLVSNVPLVALYLPVLRHAGASAQALLALAAGSTVAGNLLILGAASNVIIVQNAERRGGETLTFLEFARVGIPLTAANVLVYWAFLSWR